MIYYSTGLCHHSAIVNADCWPDETVLLDLDKKGVCTRCGIIGADVRPNWSESADVRRIGRPHEADRENIVT